MMSPRPTMENISELIVPESLKPRGGVLLPELTYDVIKELGHAGWSRVGIMVAFVDSDGQVMMLAHHQRDKNQDGALGPLGETTRESKPIIEQPLQTLFRGIKEELGVKYPGSLNIEMNQDSSWVINQWPRGNNFPGEFSCAISFPVFITDSVKTSLLAIPHATEETKGLNFISPEAIMATDDQHLRPGVKSWLHQLEQAGLLTPEQNGSLRKVDFSSIFEASLKDLVITKENG